MDLHWSSYPVGTSLIYLAVKRGWSNSLVERLCLIEYLHARLREAAPARLGCGQLVVVFQAGSDGCVALRAKQHRYLRD